MSSILITGGTGYLGSWVTRKLIEQGARVVTYSRHPDTTYLKDIVDRFDCVAGDVLDLPSLIHTIRRYGVERVIHMSTTLSKALEANPFLGYRVNVDGALNVFEASRLMDIRRVVYISSKAVYDTVRGEYAQPTYKPIDEDYPKAPHAPVGVYGATKLFMENMGLSYDRIYGLDFVALRFAATYGPGQLTRHIFSSTSKIIESAMLGGPLKVSQDDIDQLEDMAYIKDMANGVVLACFTENLKHRIFHLGAGKQETLRHAIEIVTEIFGELPVEIGPRLGTTSFGNPCIFNIDRARRELGYSPQYDLEAGIRDYIETMRMMDIGPVVLP
jgi:UDP-glucose 4-epimerase